MGLGEDIDFLKRAASDVRSDVIRRKPRAREWNVNLLDTDTMPGVQCQVKEYYLHFLYFSGFYIVCDGSEGHV